MTEAMVQTQVSKNTVETSEKWKQPKANTCWCTACPRLVCQQSGGLWSHLSHRMCCQCKPTCPRTPHRQNTWRVKATHKAQDNLKFKLLLLGFLLVLKYTATCSHRMTKAKDSLGVSLFRKNLSPSKTFFWTSWSFCSFSLASMFSISSWRKKTTNKKNVSNSVAFVTRGQSNNKRNLSCTTYMHHAKHARCWCANIKGSLRFVKYIQLSTEMDTSWWDSYQHKLNICLKGRKNNSTNQGWLCSYK